MNIRLGLYDSSLPPKITSLGITYFPYGLDDYPPNRLRKTCNKMTKLGVEPYLITQFREWAARLPAELPAWIDNAYTERINAWRACVGYQLPNGKTISKDVLDKVTPGSFKVILHPEPFQVPQTITAGAAYIDRVEVVIAYLGPYEGKPNAWLRKCDDLCQWEISNMIGIRHGFSPMDVSQEIGNRSPCNS
jgi:hypothetical protein